MSLYLGFLLAIFLEYVRPGGHLPIIQVMKINTIVPMLVFLLAIFRAVSGGTGVLTEDSNTKWILFFLFLLCVSLLQADVTLYSFEVIKTVLGYVFFYYMIIILVTDAAKLKGLLATLVISHIIVLALNPVLITDPAVRSYIQGHTFLGDGNDFSLSIVIVLPMCIYLLVDSKTLMQKILYSCAILILILAVVGTQSRGATLALSMTFIYIWWVGRQKFIGLIAIGAVVAAVLVFAPPVYFERLGSIANYEQEGSAEGRIEAWKGAMRMVAKYPILGVGSGHYAVSMAFEFRPPDLPYDRGAPAKTAHSMYFLLLGELGLPGIIFLLVVLTGNFIRNSRLIQLARGSPFDEVRRLAPIVLYLNASLVAFSVGGAFLSVAYYPHLYVLLGMFVVAHSILEDKLKETQAGTVLSPAHETRDIWDSIDAENRVWRD